jgi:prenyltransferase beta subunit
MAQSAPFKKKVYITIGLFCGYMVGIKGVDYFFRLQGIPKKSSSRKISFRAKHSDLEGFLVETTTGDYFTPLSEFTSLLNYSFSNKRCLMCDDMTNEHADISCGDAHKFGEKQSLIVARNKRSKELVTTARNAGYLKHLETIPEEVIRHSQKEILIYKKKTIAPRLRIMKWLNRVVPEHTHVLLPKSTFPKAVGASLYIFNCYLTENKWTRRIFFLIPHRLLRKYNRYIGRLLQGGNPLRHGLKRKLRGNVSNWNIRRKVMRARLAGFRSGKRIQQNVLRYCEAMRGDAPGLYRYSAECPETLLASAFAVLILGFMGAIEKMSESEKKSWIAYLQDFQDEKTGFFLDPKLRDIDKNSERHSSELLIAHFSTFVMGAFMRLGAIPRYPLSWAHEYREPEKMKKWIESLPWDISPWVAGNWSYDMGCAMGMDYLITNDKRNHEGMNAYFDWYDNHQLKETGWWDPSDKASLNEQQYGGYHTLMVYRMFDRPVPLYKKMIDSTLSLQTKDGFFAEREGGGCCEDMDAVDTLVGLGQATDYRREDIKAALKKTLPRLLSKQNLDGGFCSRHHSSHAEFGWKLCTAGKGSSDLCSTLFQCFSIAIAGEFLNDRNIMDTPWYHHHTYCHCLNKPFKLKN